MQESGTNKIDTVGRVAKAGSDRNATIMTSRTDLYNVIILLLSTVAISGIVSLYVLCLAWNNLKTSGADPLKRAAMAAAADLLKISVFSREFGTLGIADYVDSDYNYADAQEGGDVQVRSFNTVSSLIRTSLFVAKRYQLPVMGERAASDLGQLRALEDEMHKKLQLAIKDDGTGKIYEHVKRILTSSTRGGEHLESLKIRLGFVKNKLLASQVQAEPGDDATDIISGRLRTMTPLAVPFDPQPMLLHQQVREPTFFNSTEFIADKDSDAPDKAPADKASTDKVSADKVSTDKVSADPASTDKASTVKKSRDQMSPGQRAQGPPAAIPIVILIEAQFAGKGEKSGLVTSKACIAAGADMKSNPYAGRQPEGSLSITFPQGRPDAFTSLESILLYKGWLGKGQWQQSSQGPVPGQGQLVALPATPAQNSMNGSEALSLSPTLPLAQAALNAGLFLAPGRIDQDHLAYTACPQGRRQGSDRRSRKRKDRQQHTRRGQ